MTQKIKINYTYKTISKPWGGANTFLKYLYEELSSKELFDLRFYQQNYEIKNEIIFMNQLSKGPGNNSIVLTKNEINFIKSNSGKLVVRAVNLNCNSYNLFIRPFSEGKKNDKLSIYLLNLADHVIFQSKYQMELFRKNGYIGNNYNVIHNGSPFHCKLTSERIENNIKLLQDNTTIHISSSSFSTRANKRHDLIAKISKLKSIKITHFGSWPEKLDPASVELRGIVSHEVLYKEIAKSNYFLHTASNDPCPNSVIEALSLGIPVIYNAAEGSSAEIVRNNGIALNLKNLEETRNKAFKEYSAIKKELKKNKEEYSIKEAASKYASVFHLLQNQI